MGGFEGGDEAGFWDNEAPTIFTKKEHHHNLNSTSGIEKNDLGYTIKAHAKVNIFFKIREDRDGYPTFFSRSIQVKELFDTISFVPSACKTFTIEGCDDIPLESNTIYKAYLALYDATADSDIIEFFHEHKVVVNKQIPLSKGLAGSISNAAAFMRLAKEVCNLVLSNDELIAIGSFLAPDIAFFIYNYPSANVSGSGKIIDFFDEETIDLELFIPKMKAGKELFNQTFKERLLTYKSLDAVEDWQRTDSRTLIRNLSDPHILNDLYTPSLQTFPQLKKEAKKAWYLSGFTFFRLRA